ncbi:hypothetical protein ACFL1J_06935, partial [Pseudomonadota bacterium]
YGSGKSHLALTCATLLAEPNGGTAEVIVKQITQADTKIGQIVAQQVAAMDKPALVLPLDGMAGFHLGNALSRAVFQQLRRHDVDTGAIRELSPRFQTAEQFVERNFSFRTDSFAERLPGLTEEQIRAHLRENDERVYTSVDALYIEANGHPIPIEGQESAQELIDTLCSVYCGQDGPFSHVVILFDELGRYLEYAAEKPQLAGDSALQQIFQGVQDNNTRVRFIGFIQYELKAYLKRFSGGDLRQLQRYITRFDAADKWYLSTNLETIFAHMIGKDEVALQQLWQQTGAEKKIRHTWQHLSGLLPTFSRFPVWSDYDHFEKTIAMGCWPLHPFAVWFLTRQRDLVQSRSALTFIKDVINRIANEEALFDGRLRQVSAAELVIGSMLPELVSAERETGGATAETLQMLLEKFKGHLDAQQQLVLAGVAVVEKTRIGKQPREMVDDLLCEATALSPTQLPIALDMLYELGAVEWNDDLGQYELLSDGATRGQFQQWLRTHQVGIKSAGIRDLFVRRGAADIELENITPDFSQSRNISTPDWFFEAQLAHVSTIENVIQSAFLEWQNATLPKDAKGKVIYLYLHADDDPIVVGECVQTSLNTELERHRQPCAPIWVIGISDRRGALAEHIGRLYLLDEQMPAGDQERFRRFTADERERSRAALKTGVQQEIKERLYWIAGFPEAPSGRLRTVSFSIFEKVYPNATPFPFDGFGSAAGGGPADAVQLARGLIARQVSGPWVQSQPKRLQNRVDAVLVQSWKALLRSGKLVAPSNPGVKALYQWLEQAHREDPQRNLLVSYRDLIAPPNGLNASSAALLLGLLLGLDNPPRRIEQAGELLASSDWLQEAFPSQRGRHHLNEDVLAETCLRFLSLDSEDRWRELLSRWEAEENYEGLNTLSQEAENMRSVDPLPEALEGNYNYLWDRSSKALAELVRVEKKLDGWWRGIEKADQNSNVSHAIKIGDRVLRQIDEITESPKWPAKFVEECKGLTDSVHRLISQEINGWIPRQTCQTATQVPEFRTRIEQEVSSLNKLGFRRESHALVTQAQQSIGKIEKLQQFSLTLAQCKDYPRQPEPTDSISVRILRDEITLGKELVAVVKGATSVLSRAEIDAHVNAIEQRLEKLQTALKRQRDAFGAVYSLRLETKEGLRETLTTINRLKLIFVGTRDENEINAFVVQLERILSDMLAWDANNNSVERLEEVLTHQIQLQHTAMQEYLESKEIEPAWDLLEIYQAVLREELDTSRRRSHEWIQPRLDLAKQISTLDRSHCDALEKELESAPTFLSDKHAQDSKTLLELVLNRIAELDELERRAAVTHWQQTYFELADVEQLDIHTTERLLQNLQQPPCR